MTIASDVKQCLASLKGAEVNLSGIALRTVEEESKKTLNEAILLVHETVEDLQKRVGFLEQEESQYKGF